MLGDVGELARATFSQLVTLEYAAADMRLQTDDREANIIGTAAGTA